MELKFDFGKEKVMEVIFLIAIVMAIIIASFGKVVIGGAIGFLIIIASGIFFALREKE